MTATEGAYLEWLSALSTLLRSIQECSKLEVDLLPAEPVLLTEEFDKLFLVDSLGAIGFKAYAVVDEERAVG